MKKILTVGICALASSLLAETAEEAYGRFMIRDKQNRESALKSTQDYAKQMMRDRFWLFGTKGLSDSEKAVCRSNIVERAHLTPEEEHEIFEVIPYWYKGLGL